MLAEIHPQHGWSHALWLGGHDVGHQSKLSVRLRPGHHYARLYCRVLCQRSRHFAGFYPHPTDLDLLVEPPQNFHKAIVAIAATVPRVVEDILCVIPKRI